MVKAFFDGGSRGNPGPAAYAFAIEYEDGVTETSMHPVGTTTNNEAEYLGLIALLERLQERGVKKAVVHGDSKLVIEQMKGNWKVKHEEMKKLNTKAKELLDGLDAEFVWIPREENERADAAVNQALDGSAKNPLSKGD